MTERRTPEQWVAAHAKKWTQAFSEAEARGEQVTLEELERIEADVIAKAMEQARAEEREAFAAELRAESEHRIENARAVAELPGMEDEGRLRLLAAGFIDDILHARNLDQFGVMKPTTDDGSST